MAAYNTANGTSDVATNLHAVVGAGQPDRTYSVPSDANCASSHTYTTSSTPPAGFVQAPNGSGAGINAWWPQRPATGRAPARAPAASPSAGHRVVPKGAVGDGSANLVFNAFALDAVSWSTPSIYAPATMTKAQLQGIYNCTFTDWGQVGGICRPRDPAVHASVQLGYVLVLPEHWLGGVTLHW